ncbi:ABC transporter permease subunit [Kineosporia sp. NBRC 101731]|uniref:ABC transporter permease n=1 Tax=Kineosporia sp. NBRC 101731 TaxID=3032199 RepID=UPI0024A49796|nr:ABC transporter permease subunit [Kineosporia sp. NBRC 101731]GLY33350.1 glycine/betaine ABC transporter permease [Kineosporia sp. NBRC 101731]
MPDLKIGQYGEDVIRWFQEHFEGLFDFLTTWLSHLLRWTYDIVAGLQPVPMTIVFAVVALVITRRIGLTALLVIGLLVVDSMGLWYETMQSLATVLVATIIALAIGIPVGIWSAFNPVVRAIVAPLLDFMQTVPTFVYLLPTVLFFGIGAVPGMIATIVFAAPPAVRLTQLGIRQVDPETVEASAAFGGSRWEILREVQLPLARASIMAGVNQVIMLALSMVVVAGLVGGEGLGGIVVSSVQSLAIGDSIEGGLAVVVLAIYLDRVSAALGGQGRGNPSWWPKRKASEGLEQAQVQPAEARELAAV